jgi:hypothetical protein
MEQISLHEFKERYYVRHVLEAFEDYTVNLGRDMLQRQDVHIYIMGNLTGDD